MITATRIAAVTSFVLIDTLLLGAFIMKLFLAIAGLFVLALWALITAPAWVLVLVAAVIVGLGRKTFMDAFHGE